MKLTALLPLALALSSATASAQFTTVTRPAPRVAAAIDSAPIRAQRDSVARVALTDLKTWVDSAANIATVRDDSVMDAADTAAIVARTPARQTPEARRTTAFSEGAVAPATASPLPMLALLGLTALGVGAFLLRRTRA